MDKEFLWAVIPGGTLVIMMIYNAGWSALQHPILLGGFIGFIVAVFMIFSYVFNSDSDDGVNSAIDNKEKVAQQVLSRTIKRTQDECEMLLNKKGYDLWNNSPGFLVMKKNNVAVLFNSESLNDIYNWADKAKNVSGDYTPKHTQRTSVKTEEDKYIESIVPGNFDDSY